MRVRPALLSAVLLLGGGCAGVDAPGDAAGVLDGRDGFCLTAARALSALEERSITPTAREAVEELAARAPEALQPQADEVAERLRAAREGGDDDALTDEDFRELVDELEDRTDRACAEE